MSEGMLSEITQWQDAAIEEQEQLSNVPMIKGNEALIKMQDDTIQAMAVARPRSLKNVILSVMQEIELLPSAAEKLIYRIPYKQKDGSTTYVEGLSVRAAELMVNGMGYFSVTQFMEDIDDDTARVTGIAIDLQRGNKQMTQRIVSRFVKRKWGTEHLSEDKWLQLRLSESSKASRNAVEKLMPPSLKAAVWEKACQVSGSIAARDIAKVRDAFQRLGVTDEQLDKHLGRPLSQCNEKELGQLIALGKAIKDGETTVGEAFPSEETASPKTVTTAAFDPQPSAKQDTELFEDPNTGEVKERPKGQKGSK